MSAKRLQFIDANVVMYALGGSHPLREPCKRILEKIKARSILVVTNTEVLQEVIHRYFSIGRATLGEIAYKSMTQFSTVIFPVRLQDTDSALELLKKHQSITSRDAIHAATMINNGIKEILSADPHFDLISGIKRIDPMTF